MKIAGRWPGMLILVLLLLTPAAAVATDLASLLRTYRRTSDAERRREVVVQMADCRHPQTTAELDRIARDDPDVGVRVAAVLALGEQEGEAADVRLLEATVRGGVDPVRRALASGRIDRLERLRLVETLGALPSLDAYGDLVTAAGDDDADVRAAALRAIAVHPIGRAEIGDTLVETLRRFRDLPTVVTVLDLVEDHALDRWREIEPLVAERFEPSIHEAAITLGQQFEFREAMRLKQRKEAEGYALSRDEMPEEPQPRSRLDVVYAFDATGSSVGQIAQVKRFIADHAGPLVMVRRDARVGIVAYRVGSRASPRTRTEVLPLTHDVNAALRFVQGIDQRGADSQGAAIAEAVEIALDRMPWRPNARRQVWLLADSKIDDPPRAYRTARQHRQADGTQLSVWYWCNTRVTEPEDLKQLAEKGGGTYTLADPPEQPPVLPGTPGGGFGR